MSLIHGRLGKCPCPVCLVPLEDLHDLTKSFEARSQEQAQAAFKVWQENRHRGDEMLKELGLRPVSVRSMFEITRRADSYFEPALTSSF